MLECMTSSLLESLTQHKLCLSQNPNGTDKEFPKMYISRIYDPIIASLQNVEFNFVEIGVRTGASVHLWSEYFKQMRFIGIDNEVDVVWQNSDWLEGKNIQYMKADAYRNETLALLPPTLDVLIDDGPHSISSQIWVATNYTPRLAAGGIIFIEDIQGGLAYCDRIIRKIPRGFQGCSRILDLRKVSGEGDSLVVMIHNCVGECKLKLDFPNQFELLPTISRSLYLQQIFYILSRLRHKVVRIFRR
jgi:hypothetical protein